MNNNQIPFAELKSDLEDVQKILRQVLAPTPSAPYITSNEIDEHDQSLKVALRKVDGILLRLTEPKSSSSIKMEDRVRELKHDELAVIFNLYNRGGFDHLLQVLPRRQHSDEEMIQALVFFFQEMGHDEEVKDALGQFSHHDNLKDELHCFFASSQSWSEPLAHMLNQSSRHITFRDSVVNAK